MRYSEKDVRYLVLGDSKGFFSTLDRLKAKLRRSSVCLA